MARRTRPVPAALRVAALSVLGPRLFPICKWVVRYSRYGYYVTATRRVTHRHSTPYTRGGRAHTADTHRVHVTARVRPDHGCTVDGSTRHRGSAAQSPRDRSPTLARQRQRGNTRYAISRLGCNLGIEMQSRDGYGTRGTSTLTDHGESSPRGKGATRGATWSMDMRRGEHLHAGGAWP